MRRWLFPIIFILASCFFGGWRWGRCGELSAHDSAMFLFGLRQILRGETCFLCLLFFVLDFFLLNGFFLLGWFRPPLALLTLPALPILAGLAGVNCAVLPGGPTLLLALWEILLLSSLTVSTCFSARRAVYHLSCPLWDSTDVVTLKEEIRLVLATLALGAALLLLLRKTAYFGYFASVL